MHVFMRVKRGSLVSDAESMQIDGLQPINCQREDSHYKFLGVRESVKQEDWLVLDLAAKEFLRRVSVIRPSPWYDHAKAVANNQYALPVLTSLMWTQTWPLAELQQTDRKARKITSGNGGNHSKGSTAALYLARKNGGRGLNSIEEKCKSITIKVAVNLYENTDPSMATLRKLEERLMKSGHHPFVKEVQRFAEEHKLHASPAGLPRACINQGRWWVNHWFES